MIDGFLDVHTMLESSLLHLDLQVQRPYASFEELLVETALVKRFTCASYHTLSANVS